MAGDSSELPPYFNIDPDQALRDLGASMTASGFARIAEQCRLGREDLASRGLNEAGSKTLRRAAQHDDQIGLGRAAGQ